MFNMFKLVLFTFAMAGFSVYAAESYTPTQIRSVIAKAGGPEKFLTILANKNAKMSGQMFDKDTQLTGSIAFDKTLVYYLKLINYEKKDIANLSSLRKKVASTLAPPVCTAPVASILINEHDAEYTYRAYSKSLEYLFSYSFNKKTCANGYVW